MMDIKKETPPNYGQILEVFPDIAKYKPCFCYGNIIYNPSGKDIPSDVIFHESIHSKQQGNAPAIWWLNYLYDADFRLEQEIEAYGEQYAFVCAHIHSNKWQKNCLFSMAQALSGESYGSLLSFSEAESNIKKYAKTIK